MEPITMLSDGSTSIRNEASVSADGRTASWNHARFSCMFAGADETA